MVGREVKIDRRLITIKQGKKGTFDVLSFEEHGMSLGSLTTELTSFLSKILHESSDYGTNGKNYWCSADLMYWIKIHKRSNTFGAVMQVSWARKLRKSGKMQMEIPVGVDSIGWKRFAIALDSLNPNSKNWGEDVFPSAHFAGRTRAYNDPQTHDYTTTVDALGHLDTLGEWRSGIICIRPASIISWLELGRFITSKFNISVPFELLPLDEFRAVFFIEESEKRREILCSKEVSCNNWTIRFIRWSPQSHKIPQLAMDKVFWISMIGVPLNLWTPEIIKNLSAHCGEFLMINVDNLSLEEITSIKVKVRNIKGPNNIPRILKLQTPEGDFEVLVNILYSGQPLSSPIQHKVMVSEVEVGEVDAEVDQIGDVDLSEETISDRWINKEMSRQRHLIQASSPSMRFCNAAAERGNGDDSYTTLTNSQFRTRKKKRLRKKRQKRKDKVKEKGLADKQWRQVPSTISSPLCTNFLGAIDPVSTPIQISNLNLSNHVVAPEISPSGPPHTMLQKPTYLDALLGVAQITDKNALEDVLQISPTDTESTTAKGTSSGSSNSQSLALRRLQIGLEVGMTVSGHGLNALDLLTRNIRRDEEDAEALRLRHRNPDLYLVEGDLLVEGDSDSEQEERDQSIKTPIALFSDPLDSWNESFLQAEYSNDSISFPPGFSNDNANLLSLRSLKSTIKNHHKNKKHREVSSSVGASKRVGK